MLTKKLNLAMKLLIFLLTCCNINAAAQNVETDSLKQMLTGNITDERRVYALESLSYAYQSSYPDTAMYYALQGLQLAKNINFKKGEAICVNALGNVYFSMGDNARALEMYLQYLQIKESINDKENVSVAYYNIAGAYTEDSDYNHALFYLFKAHKEDIKLKDSAAILYDLYSLASIYLRMNELDSAVYYNNLCYDLVQRLDEKNMIGAVLNNFGEIHLALHDIPNAAAYYRQSLPHAEAIKDYEVITADYYGLAKIYNEQKRYDSAVYYAGRAYSIAEKGPFFKQELEVSNFISNVYRQQNRYDSAYHYQAVSISIKDSLFNIEKLRKVQNLKFDELQRQQSIENERIKYRNNIKISVAVAVAVIIFIVAIILWRNNLQRKKTNNVLTEQKEKLENTLVELRTTQAQLIQAEKMASLGELTAGIAHEIQNPLNFVNNFSEVNLELMDELKTERHKPETLRDAQAEDEILRDIDKNLERISFHGRRADSIVKGMLQHSRKNTNLKEPANINALAQEYFDLAYHGFRVKHKSFHTEIQLHFDEQLSEDGSTVNIVPQDIGRALLNIFNNAFYAVHSMEASAGKTYKPVINVSTKKLSSPDGSSTIAEIIIEDNGTGMPENILNKIFQPFFTTKPTGQGVGLGLSIAYDIITKEHNGSITAESNEARGSKFIIHLPLTNSA